MKSSGSPCPLDQISIICFKRCPYLRSYVLKVVNEVIAKNTIPESWKKAATILIYKKGDPDLPENFRPITLEPINPEDFYIDHERSNIHHFYDTKSQNREYFHNAMQSRLESVHVHVG